MAFDEAAFAQWHQAQQQQVADYVRRQQLFDTDITGEWMWIIPHRAMLGRIWPKHGVTPKYWVITGVVPTDHADGGVARNVREAARYFALKWQLEAAGTGHPPAAGSDPPIATAAAIALTMRSRSAAEVAKFSRTKPRPGGPKAAPSLTATFARSRKNAAGCSRLNGRQSSQAR